MIVIRSLIPGGIAQTDGRLIPGDRLIAVNDVNLEHATLDQAVQVIKAAPKGTVTITVTKPLTATTGNQQDEGSAGLSGAVSSSHANSQVSGDEIRLFIYRNETYLRSIIRSLCCIFFVCFL